MPLKDWPLSERPREKLLEKGPDSLSDAELLAILLRRGIRGKSAVDVARDLLTQFGGFIPLLHCDFQTLSATKGVGISQYAALKASVEIAKRYHFETLQRENCLQNPEATRQYLKSHLMEFQEEVFACLFLDGQLRVIRFEILFKGTINMAEVHPRVIIKKVLSYNASAIILAHNHPSGVKHPSQADRMVTQEIQKALSLIDVRLLDHFIIADGHCISMSEIGFLDPLSH